MSRSRITALPCLNAPLLLAGAKDGRVGAKAHGNALISPGNFNYSRLVDLLGYVKRCGNDLGFGLCVKGGFKPRSCFVVGRVRRNHPGGRVIPGWEYNIRPHGALTGLVLKASILSAATFTQSAITSFAARAS
jgi:hypothetical protein